MYASIDQPDVSKSATETLVRFQNPTRPESNNVASSVEIVGPKISINAKTLIRKSPNKKDDFKVSTS